MALAPERVEVGHAVAPVLLLLASTDVLVVAGQQGHRAVRIRDRGYGPRHMWRGFGFGEVGCDFDAEGFHMDAVVAEDAGALTALAGAGYDRGRPKHDDSLTSYFR